MLLPLALDREVCIITNMGASMIMHTDTLQFSFTTFVLFSHLETVCAFLIY